MDRVTTKRPAPMPGYVHWVYLGAESVFFYPPGSEKEHLVVDHGIPSVDMHWQIKGKLHDHAADHRKQQTLPRAILVICLPSSTPTNQPPHRSNSFRTS